MAVTFNPFTGNLDFVGAGASTTPGGSNTQVQFNDSGSFGGSADLTWDDTAKELGVGGDINLDDGGSFTTTLQTVTPTANRVISFPNATGTVALVGGSSGQVLYNNAGALGGVSTMTFDGTSVTLAGRLINSYTSLASAPAKVFTGTWFTGGTATTTKPHVLIEPAGTTSTAWSTAGTGLGVNAASGFTGDIAWFGLNGVSAVRASATTSGAALGIGPNSSAGVKLRNWDAAGAGSLVVIDNAESGYASVRALTGFFTNGAWGQNYIALGGSASTFGSFFYPDANGIIAQRNGANAQTFRCYGTFADASNYVRAALSATSTSVTLAAETAGTGADDIPLNLTAAGTGTVKVNSVVEVAVSSTVAGLPSTPTVGMLTRVTDATAPAVGSTVTGGGAAAALVWWNGANWTVIGV